MTLACEVAYSKLVKVVMVAYVSDEDRVGNSLLQIWKLRFGHKVCTHFLSDPSPIIGYACHSLTDSLTNSLPFSKF